MLQVIARSETRRVAFSLECLDSVQYALTTAAGDVQIPDIQETPLLVEAEKLTDGTNRCLGQFINVVVAPGVYAVNNFQHVFHERCACISLGQHLAVFTAPVLLIVNFDLAYALADTEAL